MKRTLKGILIFILIASVFYLAFFVSTGHYDFREWNAIDRTHYAFYGIIMGALISTFYVVISRIK